MAALARAKAVVTSSESTAKTLSAAFGVAPAVITVGEPGTDPAPRAQGTGNPVTLLSIGSLVPRKGYDVLLEALAAMAGGNWRLNIAGDGSRQPQTSRALKAQVAQSDLAAHVRFLGPIQGDRLNQLYDEADVFVSASLYEGYGMVLAEAMARGLPIVCTTGGAAAATVPDDAGLKVVPGDADVLGSALSRAIRDPALRARLAEASFIAGQKLPTWDETAMIIAGVLRRATL